MRPTEERWAALRSCRGSELFNTLAPQSSSQERKNPGDPSVLARLPSVYARAKLVEPLVRGRRVLWVDDQPANNFYERVALIQMGLGVDLAVSSTEGLVAVKYMNPDVILSDMERTGKQDAGLEFLLSLRDQGIRTPLIFYVRKVDVATLRSKP